MSDDLDTMTAIELRRRVTRKDVSPVELTHRALAKAEATQKKLNAFFVLLPEAALAAARAAEDAVMRGQPLGLLHGLPFSAKDLIAVAGVPYASGSRAMAKNIAAVDALAVERAQTAGADLIGKTTIRNSAAFVATHSGTKRAGVRSEPRPDYRTRQLQCQVLAIIDIKMSGDRGLVDSRGIFGVNAPCEVLGRNLTAQQS
jgi:Asp-tRNA(Asn)/Glu-tRNA(Gln) amidotransferase A subunit family amidase